MKIAIYCRVSTRDQNPECQRREVEEYAKRMGYDYKIFEEIESSRNTRPIKADLLALLRLKEFDGVLVWRLDRWARSLSELALEVKELHEKGVSFISLKEGIDLSTASGKLQFHIISAFAEFERDLIRERTMAGLSAALANGKKLGRPSGSGDKKPRRKSGYHLRYAGKK